MIKDNVIIYIFSFLLLILKAVPRRKESTHAPSATWGQNDSSVFPEFQLFTWTGFVWLPRCSLILRFPSLVQGSWRIGLLNLPLFNHHPFLNGKQITNNHFETFVFATFFFFVVELHLWHMEVPRLGQIRDAAASLYHSHTSSELHLWPTPQLVAMPDP